MKLAKRLLIWLAEISCQMFLIALYMVLLFGDRNPQDFVKGVLFLAGLVGYIGFVSGYLVTTFIFRAFDPVEQFWIHPPVTTFLYFLHFEALQTLWKYGPTGEGFSDNAETRKILAAGACIVFLSTVAGNIILRKWIPPRSVAES
jgi:hypothetical protein